MSGQMFAYGCIAGNIGNGNRNEHNTHGRAVRSHDI